MRSLLTFLFFILNLVHFSSLAQVSNAFLNELRADFYHSTLAPIKAEKIMQSLEKIKNEDSKFDIPIINAYQGAAEAVFVQTKWNPFTKLRMIKNSLQQINYSIEKNPKSMEIHFLRFAVEHHIPSFLDLSPHIEEDIKVILQNAQTFDSSIISKEMWEYILKFMIDSHRLTPQEEQLIINLQSLSQL